MDEYIDLEQLSEFELGDLHRYYKTKVTEIAAEARRRGVKRSSMAAKIPFQRPSTMPFPEAVMPTENNIRLGAKNMSERTYKNIPDEDLVNAFRAACEDKPDGISKEDVEAKLGRKLNTGWNHRKALMEIYKTNGLIKRATRYMLK